MALMMTLLLVVGCDVSPVLDSFIPKDCVEVSVMVSSGRDLDYYVKDGSKIEDYDSFSKLHGGFYYKLEPQWSYTDENKPYGIVSKLEKLPENGKIGWVTPGCWKISIWGYNNYVPAFYGEQIVYFSSNNSSTVVYIEPYGSPSSFSIELTQPMYSENPYEYSYVYSLIDSSGALFEEGLLNYPQIDNSTENKAVSGNYYVDIDNIPAGFYSLTIKIYRNAGNNGTMPISDVKKGSLVGGITKGVFFCAGVNLAVKGSIEPSDYTLGNIEISGLCFVGSISHGELIIGSPISFTLDDQTVVGESTYNISYQWFVDGNIINGANGITFNHKFNTYGPKEVSCLMVYQDTVNTEKVYSKTVKDVFTITP